MEKTSRIVTNWKEVPSDTPFPHREYIEGRAASLWKEKRFETNLAIEIGSYLGSTTLLLSQFFPCVFAVDIWGDTDNEIDSLGSFGQSETFLRFLENIRNSEVTHRVHPMIATSNAFRNIPSLNADIIFVDASHHYEAVKNDINNMKNHLSKDGLLIFHDYHHSWPGVVRAVDEFLCKDNSFYMNDEICGVLVVKREG